MKRLSLLSLILLASPALAGPCELRRIAYAPQENLEQIDVDLLGAAKHRIDMAAYVLTSIPVIDALTEAARRGVTVRLYRDGRLSREPRALAAAMERLHAEPSAEIRYKASPAPFMHLKAYAADGILREGAGNFTHSGLMRQDNSLVALQCEEALNRFEKAFEAMWRRP
ncbi:phospholipase D-like domain-containing protein [Methylocystis heyeri]|uniref:phospholipase D-like domain-containing protein n=1 Tax=Methylocystis heyeri TaxID=391905 RepID=UPI00113F6139|nr:phospholipase D-like domain-containing protein [Methylocystis heyeri]